MLVINNYRNDFIGIIYMQNSEGNYVNVNIYKCNGLGAYATRLKTKDNMYSTSLWGFWNDEQHLKNCLGLSKDFKESIYEDKISKITFIKPNDKYTLRIIETIGKYFVKAGYKVIFNADIKEVIYND